ncbi:MAG: rRNA maturation RNase YbeY [Legionellaceae bacterium]|nr:rRNA maturation RNase YbeY [Legionellaceae bacterium]
MTYHIEVQHASVEKPPVNDEELISWATLALAVTTESAELTLRLVDAEEMTYLNTTYRKQNKPTNVLSFPANLPKNIELECPLLGDIVICPAVLKQESIELNKSLDAHWALIVIHGVLHLLDYDHIQDDDAAIMQNLEIKLLSQLGFDNPYLEDDKID